MLKKLLTTTVVFLLSVAFANAQNATLSGTVTNSETGDPLVGANVYISSIQQGAATNADGHYEITGLSPGNYTVRVTYVGFHKVTRSVDITSGQNTVDFKLQPGIALSQVVVTAAMGQQQSLNSVTFATQEIDAEELNTVQSTNIASSLAGKIAGIQFVGQAGSKLGSNGKIRIRSQMSLTGTISPPLVIIDGVPVTGSSNGGGSPLNMVDINNVKSVNVLKGPNATALYGSRGANGVVIITTKGGQAHEGGVSVELNNSLTIDKISYLPEYQNKYGQGELGQGEWRTYNYDPSTDPEYFKPMDGVKYILNSYDDASWGPKLDGTEYGAWYNWFPDSPYYAETTSYVPHPNNIKNFYNTGITNKANVAVNYSMPSFKTRISYTNIQQKGITPYTSLDKHLINTSFSYDVTDDFHVDAIFDYTFQGVEGQTRGQGYNNLNQTSHSFNQWSSRGLNMKRMKELVDLKTPEGYFATWSWWNPDTYSQEKPSDWSKKMAFWFNPYTWQKYYQRHHNRKNLIASVQLSYQIGNNWELHGKVNRTGAHYLSNYKVPYVLQYSTDQSGGAYTHFVNSFGHYRSNNYENDFRARLNYKNNFGDWTVDAFAGTQFRMRGYSRLNAGMDRQNYISGGLVIPNVYTYSNSREQIVPTQLNWKKEVYSLFAHANIGYQNLIYLDGSIRRDWSSALPANNNGYTYPSIGLSFVFSELLDSDVLTFGKLRGGWSKVGSDVGAEYINQQYRLSDNPYSSPITGVTIPKEYTPLQRVDPNIKPAFNKQFEIGVDLGFYGGRIGLSATYNNRIHEDDIIGVSVSSATGYSSYLTNAGKTHGRGFELTLDAIPVQSRNFRWKTIINFSHSKVTVEELPADLQTYTVRNTASAFGQVNITHVEGEPLGQIYGNAIARNDQGKPIISPNGLYVVEPNHPFGSYQPDFLGGWVNNFSYKGLSLQAVITYQKGGKFYSLSDMWGSYSGLFDYTANLNDKGNPKRADVADGGGVHIQGVDTDGNPVDKYISAYDYYHQWYSGSLAEPFVYSKTYVKLKQVSLSYTLPKRWFDGILSSVRVSLIGQNLLMLYLPDKNHNNWDPSILAHPYGESGQLPGMRSYGFNVHISF